MPDTKQDALIRIIDELKDLAGQSDFAGVFESVERKGELSDGERISAAIYSAERMLEFRKRRKEAFPDLAAMFNEPVWDMVTHLFLATVRGTELTISELERLCGIPHTTAFRYKQMLADGDWIEQRTASRDARRQPLSLKARRIAPLLDYFLSDPFN